GKRFYVEVKGSAEMVPQLIEELGRSGLTKAQIVVIAFKPEVVAAVKAGAPQYTVNLLSGFKKDDAGQIMPTIEKILETLKQCGADGFSSSHDLIEKAVVRRVMDAGYAYHVWTVDDAAVAERFIQWGAKSITTNAPGRIRNALGIPYEAATKMERIVVGPDGKGFVGSETGKRFIVWGFNYDHDVAGRLIEAYWDPEWDKVVGDFREMKALGANTVRIHLQVSRFLKSAQEPNDESLRQLARLVKLAEETGLYLDITGLGCYLKKEVPAWYDALSEGERWAAQAVFWSAVAKVCADSPAVFCYDLMNEPIAPADKKETDWLVGEFAGMNFVQRISLGLEGRKQEEVTRKWIDTLVAAIRSQDKTRLITIGEIPWALSFPGAKSFFHSKEVGSSLDFVSVHFYPKKGEVDKALKALAVYDLGKPLIIEEMFPLECGVEELDQFIEGSRPIVDGWIGFYWGKTIEEYARENTDLAGTITKTWLEYFRKKKIPNPKS
ncbi:MAG: cellulase family glycosylhydrolase, partial [Phycisphaerae bacterium]|nr:cellulase family glycosylhydrolase [Phycisphaerae bacterium]